MSCCTMLRVSEAWTLTKVKPHGSLKIDLYKVSHLCWVLSHRLESQRLLTFSAGKSLPNKWLAMLD